MLQPVERRRRRRVGGVPTALGIVALAAVAAARRWHGRGTLAGRARRRRRHRTAATEPVTSDGDTPGEALAETVARRRAEPRAQAVHPAADVAGGDSRRRHERPGPVGPAAAPAPAHRVDHEDHDRRGRPAPARAGRRSHGAARRPARPASQGGPASAGTGARVEALLRAPALLRQRRRADAGSRRRREPAELRHADEPGGAPARPAGHALRRAERRGRPRQLLERLGPCGPDARRAPRSPLPSDRAHPVDPSPLGAADLREGVREQEPPARQLPRRRRRQDRLDDTCRPLPGGLGAPRWDRG